MKPDHQEPITRWYQEPMMLLVIGLPLLTVIWGGVMLTTAMSGKDSLVSDSYYKDGVSYTEDLATDQKAKRLQIKASATFDADEVILELDGYLDDYPNTLQMQLIHPTLQERDVTLLLQNIDGKRYAGVNDIELPSRRRIWLDSPEQGWRIRANGVIESGLALQLQAK